MTRVGICEDDEALRSVIDRALRGEGFDVRVAETGGGAVRAFAAEPPDLLVLDIGLPDADGRDVCQALRSRGIHSPVLFLTARESVAERISGFDAGGDDYVTKPFAFAELVARLHALLRRGGADTAVEAAGLRLDPVSHAVEAGPDTVPLSPTEFRLLARLLARPGEAVRRRDLIRAGWPLGAIVRDNTLDAYIARLRRKLRELPSAPQIATVHGVGYRIV